MAFGGTCWLVRPFKRYVLGVFIALTCGLLGFGVSLGREIEGRAGRSSRSICGVAAVEAARGTFKLPRGVFGSNRDAGNVTSDTE